MGVPDPRIRHTLDRMDRVVKVESGISPKAALRRPGRHERRSSALFFWAFLSPALALTLLFVIYPFLESSQLVFQAWEGFGEASFVGLENLSRLVADPEVHAAFLRTIVYTLITTAGTVIVGLLLGLAFYRRIPFTRTLKFLAFLPVILPPTFVALAWRNALDPTFGWVNQILGLVNPEWSRPWLSDPQAALPIAMAVLVLQYSGIPMVLILASLNDIPASIIEAATLDGASRWQLLRHILLPMSRDVLVVVVSMELIGHFKFLDSVYALTGGGPGRATDILPTLIYRVAFDHSEFGYGSAIAMASTVFIVAVSMLYTFVFRPRKMSSL